MPHSLRSSGLSILAISRFDSNVLARAMFPSKSFGLLLSFVAHPGEVVDVFSERLLQGVDHPEHALLPFGTECHVHVSLPQRFAQFAIGEVDAALPARLNFLLARKVLLELEIGVDERLRQ